MDRFARVVIGYHGCEEPLATQLITGELAVRDWQVSANPWDWLGKGIYFWEYAPERAAEWARMRVKRKGGVARPAVVGAYIQLGTCFDLTNVLYTEMLDPAFKLLEEEFTAMNRPMPDNRPLKVEPDRADDRILRERDCLVINRCMDLVSPTVVFQTVRGAFWEGEAAFSGAMIRKQSHVQIAVRDPACILGVFRPNLEV